MIHAYHVTMPMYGFWLPNDPRGSWSDFVRKWELARLGKASNTNNRKALNELTKNEIERRDEAFQSLKYSPVSIDGHQALAIARGFANMVKKCNYSIWACSILPDHTHIVVARHEYKVEQIANLLKGASTTQIVKEGRHPLARYAESGANPPRMWASSSWSVFLDTEESIEEAIEYVESNPVKEGKPKQTWSFVSPFEGIENSGWITYH